VSRLTQELSDLGESINHKRVVRLKQENDIYPKQHKWFVITTDSSHGKAIVGNLLNRQFDVKQSNTVWVSDITYIATTTGWVYLAVIIALFSRHIISWQLADHMKAELVCQAIVKTRYHRCRLPKLFHSDRGSQYVSEGFENVIPGVTLSMRRKGLLG